MPYTRYKNLETTTLPDGRTVYKPGVPKSIKPNFSDAEITAGDGDRMDIIAYNVYSDANSWWKIALANNIVNGKVHITPNTTIKVPLK